MTIYSIVDDIFALRSLMEESMTDSETGEVRDFSEAEIAEFIAWLEENQKNLDEKFNAIYKVYCNKKACAKVAQAEREILKHEMDRLSSRVRARENESARIKTLFVYALSNLNMRKYKTNLFSIGWQATRKTAKPQDGFFNPDKIPVEFLKRELSSSAIDAAIKEGRLYEKDDPMYRGALFYIDENGEQKLHGVSYSGTETLVIR